MTEKFPAAVLLRQILGVDPRQYNVSCIGRERAPPIESFQELPVCCPVILILRGPKLTNKCMNLTCPMFVFTFVREAAMERNRVVVRVPATSANMGPGFDCLGMALSIWSEVTMERADK